MVRSPAASRKRRIDSSSAELEEQPATSPRKSKLRKVSVPSPESSVQDEDAEGAEEEEQPALEAGSAGSTSASLEGNEEDAEEDAEYQEKYKIWEMFADEYHDIVEQLPLELQRSFQLMLEHDEQMRAHQRALQTATKEYLHLAKSDAYQDAMIKAQLARKMAANLGTTDITPVVPSSHAVAANAVHPSVDHLPVASNGGVDYLQQEQASNSSGEEVQNALIRSASPSKTREPSPGSASAAAPQQADNQEDPADHMRKLLGDIVTHSRAAIKAGDDKVALAVTAYSWVDRHIHRLDSDLMKHEEALSLGLRPGTQPSTDAQEALGHSDENANTSHLQDPAGLAGGGKGALPYDSHVHHSSPSRKKKGKSKSASLAPTDLPPIPVSDADVEKYCYCQQASEGIMVGCDNPQCKLQWFHLACLNMTAPPEVEPWYCPQCAPLMQKKAKKKKSSRR